LLVNGSTEKALECIHRAREIDPISATLDRQQGKMSYRARRYEEARLHLEGAVQRHPLDEHIQSDLGLVYLLCDRPHDAMGIFRRGAELRPQDASPKAFLAYAQGAIGNRKAALTLRNELCSLAKQRYVSPYLMAVGHIAVRDNDLAFRSLNDAISQKASLMIYLNSDPLLDPLRKDRRFATLQNDMNFLTVKSTVSPARSIAV